MASTSSVTSSHTLGRVINVTNRVKKTFFYVFLFGITCTSIMSSYWGFSKITYLHHHKPAILPPTTTRQNRSSGKTVDANLTRLRSQQSSPLSFVSTRVYNTTRTIAREPLVQTLIVVKVLTQPRKSPPLFNRSVTLPTDPKYSFFKVLSRKAYTLCDTLDVYIEVRNDKNITKPMGGDYFWAWIYSQELRASAAADVIVDHHNGSYTAKFKLHWAGKTTIAVSLIHSSEAVSILRYLRDSYPARCAYSGLFLSGKTGPTIITRTPCHITTDMYIKANETSQLSRTFCNFTDERTGFPWFCVKPDDLTCDTFYGHEVDYSRIPFINSILSEAQRSVFKRPKLIGTSDGIVTVQHQSSNTINTSTCERKELRQCFVGGLPTRPFDSTSGFYYKDQWQSLVCNNTHFPFPGVSSRIRGCLQNHTLHFWGDSTIRQWYEYFATVLKSTLDERKAKTKFGPHIAVDNMYNITFHFRFHGFPLRSRGQLVKDILYVPNLIDEIPNDGNVLVLLSLWAHFTPNDLSFYRQRWERIKSAIVRLKSRNPDSRFVVKSANTRKPTSPDLCSWYAWQLDRVMRDVISELDYVFIIDAWDMTIGHRTGVFIHPKKEIISQEIDMLLSYLCP